jgi:hypothetical protein
MKSTSFGVLTCILPRNVHEAVALGRSAARHCPGLGMAVVVEGDLTAQQRALLESCFHHIIPMRSEHFRLGWQAKNVLFSYTPFERSLFLDADCLVMGDLGPAFAKLQGKDLCFVAKSQPGQETGRALFAKVSLQGLMDHFHTDWWPQILGGGHFYFEKTDAARRLFESAYAWSDLDRLRPFGWTSPNVSDELTLQMAVVEEGRARERTLCDEPLVLWTPWVSGNPDVMTGRTYCKGRDGVPFVDETHPVVHFGGDHQSWIYQRERWRLAFDAWCRQRLGVVGGLVRAFNAKWLVGVMAFAAQKKRRLPGRLKRLLGGGTPQPSPARS